MEWCYICFPCFQWSMLSFWRWVIIYIDEFQHDYILYSNGNKLRESYLSVRCSRCCVPTFKCWVLCWFCPSSTRLYPCSSCKSTLLPLTLKVDGGCVFTPVCLSVCLVVCEHDISKSYGRIWRKLGRQLGMWRGWIDSILVQVRIQIRPISGKQHVTCSAWQRFALYRVPFWLFSSCMWFIY